MPETTPSTKGSLWYKDAIIYELHIKAFCDSNGDGTGDFNGLISRLDYLQSLGITAIWLLPFYPSPLKDDGYDIADYYSINPTYGDREQFKRFLDEAHQRGLKVITELVINHTSDQHPWFRRARLAPKGSPERDFYVWTDNPHQYRDVRIIFQDFEASNWTWDPVAAQYYWHRFFHHQPDLNYDNPLVQEEIFKIIDYWCSMGVDGFRLDAVPYLFEREGTNGENLPETHAFLKKLRSHVDAHFPGTLLLAEANMWPEDSASYFGNGDECHMNYHFPVMPRLFMALQTEDRYPVTDIFEQTPEIPANCQWAMFLRNHDELTLEMVTDEERDYMYKVYTKDPKARINLGIRHRLAPLLGNNRKKIELLNSLLFSLPGTPVIYYGDEIGMGDNFYLGDRDGVRTPMQWNADRNAGFSDCEPYKLYLPVISDPCYHYEWVNADVQSKDPSSLLWWMRRAIRTRKKYKAFGRGNMVFLPVENPRVLAFTRSYEQQTILVLVNFSRYIQPVELDLPMYEGHTPVELFGRYKFPAIKKECPYFFTLAPFDCQWFLLEAAAEKKQQQHKALEEIELESWQDLLLRQSMEVLESGILPGYLTSVRWFGGKSRIVQTIKALDKIVVPVEHAEPVFLLLMEVLYDSGLSEIYQLPLAFAENEEAQLLKKEHSNAILCKLKLAERNGVLYDAAYSKAYQQQLFRNMVWDHAIHSGAHSLSFKGNELQAYAQQHPEVGSKILGAEQSNTSITYNDAFILKLYRKVDREVNPDLELTRYLTKLDFAQVPAYAGSIQWQSAEGTVVLGMMQELVKNRGDAWNFMQEELQQYYDAALSQNNTAAAPLWLDVSRLLTYEDLRKNEQELFGEALAEKISLLGTRTAEMHLALASPSSNPELQPEEFSLHYQRSLFAGFQSLVRATFHNAAAAVAKLPENVRPAIEELLSLKPQVLQAFSRIYRQKINALKIRVHGDYHLGQVLVTGNDLVILDFEGEPARTYSERRLKRTALKDVAGMIRSFHYAAYAALFLNDKITLDERSKLIPFAEQWAAYASHFFMRAYLEAVKGSSLLPENKEDLQLLLDTYLLEKAIYELNYELNNRPDWVIIPLQGILSITRHSIPEEQHVK